MLLHIMDQPELEEDEGPIGIILAPTRELVQQIYKVPISLTWMKDFPPPFVVDLYSSYSHCRGGGF